MMRGDLLEGLEGLVRLKTLRNVLGALITDAVGPETASESQTGTSGGADGGETMCGGVLERGEGLVLLQALRDVLRALITNRIVPQTRSQKTQKLHQV